MLEHAIKSLATSQTSCHCYLRERDAALGLEVRALRPDVLGSQPFTLETFTGRQIHLDLHQANLLIARLTTARDAYQAAMEAQIEDERARYAPLAEPDDAAPGHELIESLRFTATVMAGAIYTVEGAFSMADAIFHRSAAGLEQIDRVLLHAGDSLAEGDVVALERLGPHTVRLTHVIAASGNAPIDYFALYRSATTPPDDEEERMRFYDEEREANERWEAARIGPGVTQSMFPIRGST